jgi:hypothetical protein
MKRRDDEGWSGPSSASHGVYKRPTGPNADGAATVRNILPWRNMEKELAKRLAEKAAKGELSTSREVDVPAWKAQPPTQDDARGVGVAGEVEPAPDSGVRASAPGTFKAAEESMRPLTYSMYTVSELDEAGAPYKSSHPVPARGPQPSGWNDVGKSGLVLLHMLGSWARAGKTRPRLMDHVRVPLAAFGADLRGALGRLPWRKIGWTSLITVGSLVLFIFAVVTVAELTDDLKPARTATASKYNLQGSGASTALNETTSAKIDAPGASAGEASAPAQIEIDDESAPPVAKKTEKAPPAPRPTKPKAKKPKPPDMFNP